MRWLPLLFAVALVAGPTDTAITGKQEFRTPNGLRVIVEERHERPVLRLRLMAGWNPGDLSVAQLDQALRLRSVLGHCGAGGLSRSALDRRLADRGIRLEFEGTDDSLSWSLLADSQDQEDAFELLGNSVFRPDLGDDLGPVKAGISPEQWFRASLGFPDQNFGHPGLGMEDRFTLHRLLVRPEHSILVIQGDLSLSQARQLVMLHLGTWAPAPREALSGSSAPLAQPRPELQEGAWVGSPAPRGDAKHRAAHIAVTILLSKIFREESQGSIIFETSRPGGDAGPLLFGIRSGEEPEKRLWKMIDQLCGHGFVASDLMFVHKAWQAERSALALHPEDQMYAAARIALKGDPGAYLMEVSLEGLNTALRARLKPESLQWLVSKLNSK